MSAPASAYPYVRAIGPKICPSTPCMVKSGTNPATVISVEKKMARSTCVALINSQPQPVGPLARATRPVVGGRVAAKGFVGQAAQQSLNLRRRALKDSEHVLDQDDGRVHDDAEIHCSDREQVGALAPQTNRMTANSRANGMLTPTRIALRRSPRKIHWTRKTSRHPRIRLCSTVCVVTRISDDAVVVRNEPHAWGQRSVAVQSGDLRFDCGNHVGGLLVAIHHNDRADDIISWSRPMTPRRGRLPIITVATSRTRIGTPFVLRQDDVLDVVDSVALSQVIVASVIDQADTTDVDRLLPDTDLAPAHVDVRVAQGGEHLGDGDPIRLELARIELYLEFFGGASPTVDRDDTRDCRAAGGPRSSPGRCGGW